MRKAVIGLSLLLAVVLDRVPAAAQSPQSLPELFQQVKQQVADGSWAAALGSSLGAYTDQAQWVVLLLALVYERSMPRLVVASVPEQPVRAASRSAIRRRSRRAGTRATL